LSAGTATVWRVGLRLRATIRVHGATHDNTVSKKNGAREGAVKDRLGRAITEINQLRGMGDPELSA
jgi:arginase family enzyme